MKPAILALLVSSCLLSSALAQPKPDAPATPPAAAAAEELRGTVTAVQGIVQYRHAPEQPWQWVATGLVVSAGTELRTGPRSMVQISIPPQQTLVLDRLGTVTLLQAAREASGKIDTDIGLKYGRASYKLETGGIEHESIIRTPGSTLAVRGSEVLYQHDAFTSFAYGDGHLTYIDPLKGQRIAFGHDGVKAGITGGTTPGAVAQAVATSDVKGANPARSALETKMVESLPDVGGNDLRDLTAFGRDARVDFSVGAFTEQLPNLVILLVGFQGDPSVPTAVNFSAFFNGTAGTGFDTVGIPAGTIVADGSGAGSGQIQFGQVINNVPLNAPNGTYTVRATLVSPDTDFVPVFTFVQMVQTIDGQLTPVGGVAFDVVFNPTNPTVELQLPAP